MNTRFLLVTLISLIFFLKTPSAAALTVKQFSDICHSFSGECSDHPVIQAYIGGALDLLATLDEQTDYLQKMYCKETKVLFDVPAIIHFMQQHAGQYAQHNAMLLVVRYVEQKGSCN